MTSAVSTLEKLVSLQQRRIQNIDEKVPAPIAMEEELIVEEDLTPNVANPIIAATPLAYQPHVVEMQLRKQDLREACLREQLECLYADLEYLSKAFPGHTVKSLVDLAVKSGLSEKVATPAPLVEEPLPSDNGVIPAIVMRDLDKLTEDTATFAGLGVIEIGEDGDLLWMNQDAKFTLGFPETSNLKGNFFTAVVPGANNGLFYGRFQQGREQETFDVEFNYALAYKIAPTLCVIHMIRSPRLRRYFVFIKRTEG